ncbi:uncharacterized protein F4822DRAFT_163549 [Hypoxylon trugodes]|uniref:uncharacterized protein n=1 Tax=Hypoxylon trugodes TaxID=326681 RepID=UPI00219608F7|nr:uncharacterized protein F4822DRAFT_163549 [Hypoxylon trugodes]KAI1390800.1 hypothetical protein F4822DRAFT_163549 [Hypoxylon trugodes]
MIMAASRKQCSCAEEAAEAWKHVGRMTEIGLDIIIMASSQTVDFSLQWQECQSRNCPSASEVQDTLLEIYTKLVDLLQAAIVTYRVTPGSNFAEHGAQDSSLYHHTSTSTMQMFGYPSMGAQTLPDLGVICLPSKMSLGEHELDEQQSSYLALDLVCRTLENLGGIMQQMGRREAEEVGRVDSRVLERLSRVSRLMRTGSQALQSLS